MPKIPPLSGEKLIKLLQEHGFEWKRQKGSHVVLRKGSKVCVVPAHDSIKRGTLGGILRQAGISIDEFFTWLYPGKETPENLDEE